MNVVPAPGAVPRKTSWVFCPAILICIGGSIQKSNLHALQKYIVLSLPQKISIQEVSANCAPSSLCVIVLIWWKKSWKRGQWAGADFFLIYYTLMSTFFHSVKTNSTFFFMESARGVGPQGPQVRAPETRGPGPLGPLCMRGPEGPGPLWGPSARTQLPAEGPEPL